jgi:hypothetical protein
MKGKRFAAVCMAAALLAPGTASAQDDLFDRIVNVPAPAAWRIDGLRDKPKVRSDAAVQGGKAVRIEVPGKGADPWSVAAANPIEKPVKAGDTLVLAFWARLEKGEGGAATAVLPYNAVQLSSAPYTALFHGAVTIGPEWKLHELRGKADKDYPAGALNVSVHLATARQTVELGPVFVLDMGPGK